MDYIKELEEINLPKEEINFQKYWLILKRRKKIILGVFSIVFSLGLLYSLLSKPQYRSEAKLLIEPNFSSSLNGLAEKLGKIESLNSQSDPLNAQAEILLSNSALKQTIEELQLKNAKGELILIKNLKPKINLDITKGTDFLTVGYTDEEPQMAVAVVKKLVEIYIEQNIRDNKAEATSARKFILKQLPKSEKTVQEAEFALRQFKEENSITYLKEESSASIDTVKNLEEQVNEVRTQLADVTARINNLTRETNLAATEASTIAHLSQVPGNKKLLTEIGNTESQLAAEQARFHSQYPTVINLTEKLAELQELLQQKVQQNTGGDRQIDWKNLQVGDLDYSEVRELAQAQRERVGLEKQLVEMNNTLSSYQQQAKIWPQLEQTLRELERKLKASQNTYEMLLTRLEEINIAEEQNIGNIRVISQPLVPEEPYKSKKRVIILASGLFGILLGTTVALFLELIDKSLNTPEEIKQIFPYTVLTTIPNINNSQRLLRPKRTDTCGEPNRLCALTVGQNRLENIITELSLPGLISGDIYDNNLRDAYQLLQANLRFCAQKPLKAIAVTSSVPNEGKSKLCANLATVMAQGERRILLIDCNMRCPQQHEIWKLDNSVGLINLFINHISPDRILSDKSVVDDRQLMVNKVPVEAAVHNVRPNLDVLPSGGVFGNTIALLESAAMNALVDKFRREYDVIIFDAPDLKRKPDAGLIGKLADGIVFVVRTGVADSESANEAMEFLNNSGQTVLGMVINEEKITANPSIKEIGGAELIYLEGHNESNENGHNKLFKI